MAGTIVGLVISFVSILISWLFFYKSGQQLRDAANDLLKEAKSLRHTTNLITRALEDNGIAKFNRDSEGHAIGLVLDKNVVQFLGITQMTSNATVKPPDQK